MPPKTKAAGGTQSSENDTDPKETTVNEESIDSDQDDRTTHTNNRDVDSDDEEQNIDDHQDDNDGQSSFSQRRAAKRLEKSRAQLRAQSLKTEFVDHYRTNKANEKAALEASVQQALSALPAQSPAQRRNQPTGDSGRNGTDTTTEPSPQNESDQLSSDLQGNIPPLNSSDADDDTDQVQDTRNPIQKLSDDLRQERNPVNTPSNSFDNYMKISGGIMDLANFSTAGANAYLNTTEAMANGTRPDENTLSEREELQKDHAPYKRIVGGVNLLSGVWGGFNNFLSAKKSAKGKDSNNKRVKDTAGLGVASNLFSMLGNLSKATAGGINAFGDTKGDVDQARTVRWMGFLGNLSSTIGSGISLFKSNKELKDRKKMVDDTNTYINDPAKALPANAESVAKTALQTSVRDNDLSGYSTNKTRLNEVKAKKYAMEQAAVMNQFKRDQMPKGITGTVTGIINSLSSLVGAIYPDSGMITGAITGFTGAIGAITKQSELKSDMSVRSKLKKEKINIVNTYIRKKLPALDADIAAYEGRIGMPTNMKDNEKKRIILGRLGVDLEIIDKAPATSDMESAFDFINHKRALYIMNSSVAEKNNMLAALHLENTATLQDVEAALRGD